MKRFHWLLVVAGSLPVGSLARAESAQDSAIELKIGFYKPNIDSEAALKGATPYQTYFGGSNILLFEAEYDYQLFHAFGSFGLGISAGYGEIYGHGVYAQGPQAGSVSTSDTALKMYPLKLLAVYRFDVLAKKWNIPLVPFAKVGFEDELYQITNGTGGVATTTSGQHGQGGVYGLEGDVGLAFLLDFLDPDLANDFDLNVGVNHSYIFGEMSFAYLNDFGQPSFVFSDNFLKFGLALEF